MYAEAERKDAAEDRRKREGTPVDPITAKVIARLDAARARAGTKPLPSRCIFLVRRTKRACS